MTDDQKAECRKMLKKAEALISEAEKILEPDLKETPAKRVNAEDYEWTGQRVKVCENWGNPPKYEALWEKAQGHGRYSGLKPVESLEERARLHMEEVAKREYAMNKWTAMVAELVKTTD